MPLFDEKYNSDLKKFMDEIIDENRKRDGKPRICFKVFPDRYFFELRSEDEVTMVSTFIQQLKDMGDCYAKYRDF